MITFKQKGDFAKITKYLEKNKKPILKNILDRYGKEGVAALSSSTPRDTGKTADSWDYKIEFSKDRHSINFYNTNIQNGVLIAIILQYGHGTGTGGWVEGRDYINPVIAPIFEKLKDEVWKEVTKI